MTIFRAGGPIRKQIKRRRKIGSRGGTDFQTSEFTGLAGMRWAQWVNTCTFYGLRGSGTPYPTVSIVVVWLEVSLARGQAKLRFRAKGRAE
jgi:hypothetical protein